VMTVAHALQLALFSLYDLDDDFDSQRETFVHSDVIYLKASRGRTGQPLALDDALLAQIADVIAQIRALNPRIFVALGIGIQTPQQVAQLAQTDLDMVVIGTKLVEKSAQGERALTDYVAALRAASHRK
jgi:tryptophan synthase alpha subunit